MKKVLLTFISMMVLSSFASPVICNSDDGDHICLTAERIKNGNLGEPFPTAPIRVPTASINGHTFYINGAHPDYVLQLLDVESGTVVYEVLMPADVNSVELPNSLTGEYVIQLLWGDWKFWGVIMLN